MYMRVYKKRRDIFKKISDVETTPKIKNEKKVKTSESSEYDGVNIKDLFDDKNTDIYYEEIP